MNSVVYYVEYYVESRPPYLLSTHVSYRYTTEMNQFLDELEVVVSRIFVADNNGSIMVEQSLVQDVVY